MSPVLDTNAMRPPHEGATAVAGQAARSDRSVAALVAAVVLCSGTFVLVAAAALTGWRVGVLVALAWAALAACFAACVGRLRGRAR